MQFGRKPDDEQPDDNAPEPRHHHETPFGSHEDLKQALIHRIALSRKREEEAKKELAGVVRDTDAHLDRTHRHLDESTKNVHKEHRGDKGLSDDTAQRHRHIHADRHRLRLADTVARDALGGTEDARTTRTSKA